MYGSPETKFGKLLLRIPQVVDCIQSLSESLVFSKLGSFRRARAVIRSCLSLVPAKSLPLALLRLCPRLGSRLYAQGIFARMEKLEESVDKRLSRIEERMEQLCNAQGIPPSRTFPTIGS